MSDTDAHGQTYLADLKPGAKIVGTAFTGTSFVTGTGEGLRQTKWTGPAAAMWSVVAYADLFELELVHLQLYRYRVLAGKTTVAEGSGASLYRLTQAVHTQVSE